MIVIQMIELLAVSQFMYFPKGLPGTVQHPNNTPPDSSPELCSTLLWLFVDLIKCSATCQAYVTTNRTLLVIAHLLHDVPVDYLSEAALDALLSLGR